MAKCIHALRLEKPEMATLKEMSKAVNIPFAVYMRLVCLQHMRTPLKLDLTPAIPRQRPPNSAVTKPERNDGRRK